MPNSELAEVAAKLDMLVRLQALALVARYESSKEKIIFLSKAGLRPTDIADLLQTSSNFVNVTLSKARKAEKEKASGSKE